MPLASLLAAFSQLPQFRDLVCHADACNAFVRKRKLPLWEPHRTFIEAQLRLRRNYTLIYQDLVDQFSFTGRYNSVSRVRCADWSCRACQPTWPAQGQNADDTWASRSRRAQ